MNSRSFIFTLLFFTLINYRVKSLEKYGEHPLSKSDISPEKGIVWYNDGWNYLPGNDTTLIYKELLKLNLITANIRQLPNSPDTNLWRGIGWFQRVIEIDSSLFGKSAALILRKLGAIEIYLNGDIIWQEGKVGVRSEDEKAFWRQEYPVPFNFSYDSYQLFTIRYSNFTAMKLRDLDIDGGLQFGIADLTRSVENNIHASKNIETLGWIFTGIPLVFAFLHLFMFFFYRKDIGNLYYGIITLCLAGLNYADILKQSLHNASNIKLIFHLSVLPAIILTIFLLLFAYDNFKSKIPRHFAIFIILGGIFQALALVNLSAELINIQRYYILFAVLEIGRAMIDSMIKKNMRMNFLIAGFTFFIFSLFYNLLITTGILPNIFNIPVYSIGFLFLIFTMSIHLSQNFGRISKDLEQEVEIVKELTRQKMEKEIEAKEQEMERRLLEADNKRKTNELEEARRLQISMLPKVIPQLPHLRIAAYMSTAAEVGGDYYDFQNSSADVITFALGDATGHGTKAGILVSATKSLFHELAGKFDPLEIINRFNNAFRKMNLPSLYMALLICRIEGNKMIFANSGMPPVLYYNRNSKKLFEITQKSMPLGGPANFPYKQDSFELEKGDILLFSSDGFIELFNKNNEILGLEKAKEMYLNSLDPDPEKTIENLRKKINKWSGEKTLHDDLTLLCISYF